MALALDKSRSGELRKMCESGDPSQMRQGSLEVFLKAKVSKALQRCSG